MHNSRLRRSVGLVVVAGTLAFGQALSAQGVRPALPVVWVVATGGTIAGRGASPTNLVYKPGAVTGEELVNAVPEIREYAEVKVEQLFNIGSSDITAANWLTLANRINGILAADSGVAGVVVTHGTATLEETAYFLNLTVRDDRPVVVVGAQRPASSISADGPLNLLNAIRVAATPAARSKGVLVVMNEEINAARDVTKSNSLRVETFQSGDLGLLGYVDADQVSFYRASTRRHTARSEFDIARVRELPKVDIFLSYLESNTAVLQAQVTSGAKGIVFAGSGSATMSASEIAAVKSLRSSPEGSRVVIVRSSRTGNGRVLTVSGNTPQYEALGLISADNLSPVKARILLMLALTRTNDIGEIKRMFAEY